MRISIADVDMSKFREVVDNDAPSTALFSTHDSSATIVYDWTGDTTKRYDAVVKLLGRHYVSDTTEAPGGLPQLVRVNPPSHPYYRWMRVSGVSNIIGRGVRTTRDAMWPEQMPKFQDYEHYRMTVEFRALPYNDIGDDWDYSTGEENRYVSIMLKPQAEFIGVKQGTFSFAEGTPLGKMFDGEVNFLERKVRYELKWHCVPEEWISNPEFTTPYYNKIQSIVGRVNSDEFLDFDVGTLLALEPEIERYIAPYTAYSDLGPTGIPYFLCDVTIPLVFFDPPLGATGPIISGHNNKPWYVAPAPGGPPPEVKYWYVTSDGSASGLPIYASAPFADAFKHWNS